jgi:hypothetical protein
MKGKSGGRRQVKGQRAKVKTAKGGGGENDKGAEGDCRPDCLDIEGQSATLYMQVRHHSGQSG